MYIATNLPLTGEALARAMRPVLQGLAVAYGEARREYPFPPLYSSGIRYQAEKNADRYEEWADPWTVAARRHGDCDDLVLYRLAELIAAGERATVTVYWTGHRYHVAVRRASGAVEDPSEILGG